MNFGEGNQLSEKLASLGYEKCSSAEEADLVVLNTCGVIETTEKKMIRRMGELKKIGKKIIVTGCLAKIQPKRIEIRLPDSLIIPPSDYSEFSEMVENRYGKSKPSVCKEKTVSAILPIAQGCLGNCSYCITRFARGPLKSYPEKELVDEFRKMVSSGAKEILVTAQDTACYGKDIGTDLPSLLEKMLETEGEYRIRIGMMNPNNLKQIWKKLADVMKNEKVYKFLHVPVQSGSDSVLNSMKRHYSTEEFFDLVKNLRKEIPGISIATDLISGFPGETEKDHAASVNLIKMLEADTVNITRFSSRPGTEAASMDNRVQGNISKERSTELTETKTETESKVNSKLIGKTFTVLVTERGKPGTVIARTEYYRPVAIEGNYDLGTFLTAEITGSRPTHLFGKTVSTVK